MQFRADIEQLPEVDNLQDQKLAFRDGGDGGGAFRFRQQGDLPEKKPPPARRRGCGGTSTSTSPETMKYME